MNQINKKCLGGILEVNVDQWHDNTWQNGVKQLKLQQSEQSGKTTRGELGGKLPQRVAIPEGHIISKGIIETQNFGC